jgi:hypothetical protein
MIPQPWWMVSIPRRQRRRAREKSDARLHFLVLRTTMAITKTRDRVVVGRLK